MGVSYAPNVVRNGLVLYLDAANTKSYPGSGTTWTDLSGNGRTATLVNGPMFNSANNGSIIFDGFDDHASLGTFTGLGSSNRTFSTWFKLIAFPASAGRIVTFPADDGSTDFPAYTFATNSTGSINGGFGGPPYDAYKTITTLGLGTWANITSSISGNTISNYLNGTFVNSATNTGSVGSNPIGYIGRYNQFYAQRFSGNVSFLQVYNRALSAAEIKQNFNATRSRYGL